MGRRLNFWTLEIEHMLILLSGAQLIEQIIVKINSFTQVLDINRYIMIGFTF